MLWRSLLCAVCAAMALSGGFANRKKIDGWEKSSALTLIHCCKQLRERSEKKLYAVVNVYKLKRMGMEKAST